jgi:hypothetical protein
MFPHPLLRPQLPTLPLDHVRRLAAIVGIVALAGLGGPLACDQLPFVEPMTRLTVEVRTVDGGGIAGVALELMGDVEFSDSASVYAKARTGADGTAYLGDFSMLVSPRIYRLVITPPAGYGFATNQANPMKLALTDEASDGPPGSGLYGNPARVIVRLVRLP